MQIQMSNGKSFIIDDADYDLIKDFTWISNNQNYVSTTIKIRGYKSVSIKLHRFLIDAPVGFDVDHVNLNPLDNRRCNLRIATNSQNQYNREKRVLKNPSKNMSMYKGVFKSANGKRYQTRIRSNGKSIYIGTFDTEIEAALAYDKKVRELAGDFARLNFGYNNKYIKSNYQKKEAGA